ncbi:MAG: ABC transporter substrate-binding protein [Lachnospiraceae bacterium]|nr:ABC transporter substrate-binding protein [Lachnospiraceae bacterium]
MKRTKLFALGLAMTMAATALTGCGGSNSGSADAGTGTTQTADGEKVLKFGCQMYSDGLIDPAAQTNCAWNAMRYGITESLFKFADDMSVVPWLAESCDVSPDHKTWTIKLKDGIKFSDGCDMTATKVKESLDRVRAEGPNGSSTPEKFLEYEAEVTADDAANTITITTQTAYIDLTGNLAHPVMAITDVADTSDWNNGTIGTGPYVASKFTDRVGYDLVKNENYYEAVPYDKVELLYMGDASAKAMALQNGQVDLVENITNVSDIQKLQEDDNFTVDIASGVRTGFAWINQAGVLGNDTLRKAMLMAIDYETICQSNTIGGLYTAGFSVLPSSLSYNYDKLTNPYEYDPEAAMKLMDEAGIVDTDGDGIREIDGQNINLTVVSYENRLLNDFADAQSQYLNKVGIGTTAKYGSSDDQWTSLVAGEYDLNQNNWTTVATGDPIDYMANWYSKCDSDYCGYENADYDALYEQLLEEMDADKRVELITEMQQILIDDAAVLVDGYYNSSMIYSKNVGYAHIHTADYYWLSTEITPAD